VQLNSILIEFYNILMSSYLFFLTRFRDPVSWTELELVAAADGDSRRGGSALAGVSSTEGKR